LCGSRRLGENRSSGEKHSAHRSGNQLVHGWVLQKYDVAVEFSARLAGRRDAGQATPETICTIAVLPTPLYGLSAFSGWRD
jgi:hypothetical protein